MKCEKMINIGAVEKLKQRYASVLIAGSEIGSQTTENGGNE